MNGKRTPGGGTNAGALIEVRRQVAQGMKDARDAVEKEQKAGNKLGFAHNIGKVQAFSMILQIIDLETTPPDGDVREAADRNAKDLAARKGGWAPK
ncbi:hypothetical protein [Fodinicola feengrottensis]|uniref:Uncharacterized protein n=1 Tax=Fodinicola feengrottensis TaxID=435914 RepID=A0ABN2HS60_9ACTN|nr:hypothetical protein [Fodinicola feengrottensis]